MKMAALSLSSFLSMLSLSQGANSQIDPQGTANAEGALQGFLVAVADPSTFALGAIGGIGLLLLLLRQRP